MLFEVVYCHIAKDINALNISRLIHHNMKQSQDTCECSVLYMRLMQPPVQITLCRQVIKSKMYVARPDCKLG